MRAKSRIVCITGMPGSGKEEFIKVAAKLGFDIVRMGDLIREEARKRGIRPDDSSVGNLADDERKRYGKRIWATRTLPKLKGDNIVIDGIRSIDEIGVFREEYPGQVYVISIEAPEEVRHRRIVERRREDATLTMEEFKKRDEREIGWGLASAMREADYVIQNVGSLKKYQGEVEKVLKEIMEK